MKQISVIQKQNENLPTAKGFVGRVKKTPVSNVLMFHDTELEIREHNKEWLNYAREKMDYCHQEGRLISKNHVLAGMSVKMFLMKKNLIVFYHKKSGVYPMRIMVRNPGNVRAVNISAAESKLEPIKFDKIVFEPKQVEAHLQKFDHETVTGFESDFYNVHEFKQAKNFGDVALHQCIEPGQYFELQIPETPHIVGIAKVLKNYRGLILVQVNHRQRWVHMTDPLCHGMGWVRDNQNPLYEYVAQAVSYDAGCTQELIEDAVRNAVPQFVFCSNIISKHRIEPDDIVVLADHKMATFWYAHVSMTTANFHHFFHLNIGDYLVSFPPHTEPTYFHIYHSHVFSVSKIQAAGIPIMLPDNVVPNPNESDLDAYMRVYSPNGRLVGENIGVHHHYKNNILDKMSEPILDLAYRAMNQLRCVEVLRPTNAGGLQLTAAIVTGTSHDFLRLKIAGEERHIFLHYNDPTIFHLGACIDMNLAILFNKDLFEFQQGEPKPGDEF